MASPGMFSTKVTPFLTPIDLSPVPEFEDLDGTGGVVNGIDNPAISLPYSVAFLSR
jgi:hypothetical protein